MPRDKAIRLNRLNSAGGTLRGSFFEKLKKARAFFYNIETYYFLLVCAVIVYIFLWSLIDILQELNFRQFVFDSGIITLTMNSILHYPNIQYISYMFGFSLLRILFRKCQSIRRNPPIPESTGPITNPPPRKRIIMLSNTIRTPFSAFPLLLCLWPAL